MFILFFYAIALYMVYLIYNFSVAFWNFTQLNKRIKFPASPISNLKAVEYYYSEIESVRKIHKQYGKIFKISYFLSSSVCLADPKDIEVLLTNKNFLAKSTEYKRLKPIFRTGLITSNGEIWHKHRRILNKCFTYNTLRQYGETMRSVAKDIVADIKSLLQEDRDINILQPIRKWMAFNLYRTLIGTEVEDDQKFFDAVKRISNVDASTYGMLVVLPSFIFKYTKNGKEVGEALLVLKTVTERIIADKKEALKNNTDSSKLISLTDLLVSSNELSIGEIRDEIQTFVVSGLESTTVTVSYCIYALSRHPEIQDKLYNEINTHLVSDEIPTQENLNKLTYLTCVLKETMRVYTAVGLIGRHIGEDLTLPSGNVLPAGIDAYIDLYTIHHDPEVYQDPYTFIPERFEKENAVTNASFLPFGAGPRICIGYKFAMMEMKLTLSLLLKKFVFLPSDKELEMKRRFLIVPVKGVSVKLKSR